MSEPTYDHTPADSPRYPCPECKAAEVDASRKQPRFREISAATLEKIHAAIQRWPANAGKRAAQAIAEVERLRELFERAS